jgi:hypothetical protein
LNIDGMAWLLGFPPVDATGLVAIDANLAVTATDWNRRGVDHLFTALDSRPLRCQTGAGP